jgi:NAD(P)-dependent dehydrogenase (short-subunit alcohol dehydrogenase family)
LITGTARGLGVAIAEQFGRDGANVLLVDRDTESLPDVAEKVRLAEASDVAWTGQDVNAEESTKPAASRLARMLRELPDLSVDFTSAAWSIVRRGIVIP